MGIGGGTIVEERRDVVSTGIGVREIFDSNRLMLLVLGGDLLLAALPGRTPNNSGVGELLRLRVGVRGGITNADAGFEPASC